MKPRFSMGAALQFGTLAGSRILGILLQGLALALLARSFGVEYFGYHATILAILYIGMAFTEFGLSARALRAPADDEPVVVQLARLRLASLLTSVALCGGVVFVVPSESIFVALAVATTIFAAGETCGELAMSISLGQATRGRAAFILLARRSGAVAPFAVAGTSPGAGLTSLALSGVLGILFCARFALKRRLSDVGMLQLVRENGNYWGASAVATIQRLDVIVVGAISSASLTGLYSASSRLLNPLNTVTSILLQYSIPEIAAAKSGASRERRIRNLRLAVATYSVGLVLAALLLAPFVTQMMLGPDFADASPIVAGVMIAAAISANAQTQTAEYMATVMPKGLGVAAVSASVLGVLVLGACAATFGLAGAAVGIALSALCVWIGVRPFWFRRKASISSFGEDQIRA